MKQFAYSEEAAVTPDFVAEKMLELVEKSEYPGGTSLEVSTSQVRTLGTWNISPANTTGTRIPQEALDASYAPLIAVMNKDKQAKM